jgi:hypothetical protein
VITKEMESFLYEKVKPLCHIGIVGGSDFSKIAEQTGGLESKILFTLIPLIKRIKTVMFFCSL